jgi:hypothetical protein
MGGSCVGLAACLTTFAVLVCPNLAWIRYHAVFGQREEIVCDVTEVLADCPRVCRALCTENGVQLRTEYEQPCNPRIVVACRAGDRVTLLYDGDSEQPLLIKNFKSTWLAVAIVLTVLWNLIVLLASIYVFIHVIAHYGRKNIPVVPRCHNTEVL